MLTLAILRHAKSSWGDPTQDDFDRSLNERGKSTAPVAGRTLAGLGFRPEYIVCSPARRTRETLDLALPAMGAGGYQPEIVFDERIYLAAEPTLLEVVRELPAGRRSALLVGHNPGLHDLAHRLAGDGAAGDLELLHQKFPTAAIALLSFERSRWRDIRAGDGRLETLWYPKKDQKEPA